MILSLFKPFFESFEANRLSIKGITSTPSPDTFSERKLARIKLNSSFSQLLRALEAEQPARQNKKFKLVTLSDKHGVISGMRQVKFPRIVQWKTELRLASIRSFKFHCFIWQIEGFLGPKSHQEATKKRSFSIELVSKSGNSGLFFRLQRKNREKNILARPLLSPSVHA